MSLDIFNRPMRLSKRLLKKGFAYIKNEVTPVQKTPIIVLGNPKSGTSVIGHLLADYGGLSKSIDIPPLWMDLTGKGVEILQGQTTFADMVKRNRPYFSCKLIKEPTMTFFADQVMEAFPKAKYVFVIRDPRDNVRSELNRRRVPGNLTELKEALIPADERNRQVVKAMTDALLWGGNGENYIGVLAHKWNRAADTYVRHQKRMILVKYEDFLPEKGRYISQLAQQLDIPQRRNIEDQIDVQYQPKGKDRDLPWVEFYGPDNLTRIERICGSHMTAFGYEINHTQAATESGIPANRQEETL